MKKLQKIKVSLFRKGSREGEQGAALVLAILSLLLVTILVFALYATGTVSGDISQNSRQQTDAFYTSESGLTHGMKLFSGLTLTQFKTSILTAGDGVPNTGDELSARPSYMVPISTPGINFGSGNYKVSVSDDPAETDGNPNVDSNGRLIVTSVGTGTNGSTVTTEAIMAVSSAPGIIVNGALLINGNPVVTGAAGAIHANGALTVTGNPCVAQYASSTTIVTIGGALLGGPPGCSGTGTSSPNQPPVDVPTWNIRTDFFNAGKYDYVLGDDGRVRNPAGTVLHNSATQGDDWNLGGGGKWTWKGASERKWVHGGSYLPPNKTWYVAGNMELGSDFGSGASPVPATFIAEGYITVSANPYMIKHLENRYAFMAGTDLTLNGNPSTGINSSAGIHYAGHQIKFNGNARINGVVIAANLLDTNSPSCGCNPVPLTGSPLRMEISGNPHVNYDGDLLDITARIVSWREVRK